MKSFHLQNRTMARAFWLKGIVAGLVLLNLSAITHLNGQSAQATPIAGIPAPNTTNWSCVPPEFSNGPKRDLAIAGKENRRVDWVRPPITLKELTAGLRMVKESPTSEVLVWEKLPCFPTICTEAVPDDWTGYQSIEFKFISGAATGDRLTIGVLADNPQTGYQDFFCKDFTVDWTGRKTLAFPLSSFEKIGNPLNWTGIKGLYLFSRAKGDSPDPATLLCIQGVKLSTEPVQAPPPTAAKEEIEFLPLGSNIWEAPHPLNKKGKEILAPMKPGAPIVAQYFFQNSRALFGYYPHYNPGYVSTDPKGIPFIRTTDRIQWLDDKGLWHEKSLLDPIREFSRTRKWTHFTILAKDADPTIRFDRAGTTYVIVQVEQDGKWSSQIPLLLYTSDLNAPWKWLALPGASADFEKVGGANLEALDKPPILTLRSSQLSPAPGSINPDKLEYTYLVSLEKKGDGTLTFPPPVSIGHGKAEALLMGPTHDGKANLLISRKGKIYAAYASCPVKSDPDPKKVWERPRDSVWWESLKIPADHPANKMMLDPVRLSKGEASPCSDGVPVFVRAFDTTTRKFGEPVFIGYGGRFRDVHNTPAMTVDSKGIFHVILMGHNDPALYSHTLKPDDITEWTPPTPIDIAPDKKYGCRASYPALTCDRNDNLHFMYRSDSDVYNHRLDIISKNAGSETWNTARSVFVPMTDEYHAWAHSLCYDPVRDHLFLCFLEGWPETQTQDLDLFHRFYFPFSGAIPKGINSTDKLPSPYRRPAEAVVLISKDSGKTWSHATTPDFMPGSSAMHP